MAVVSAKFQVVIPPEIRRSIGIKPGMRVRWVKEGKGARLEVDSGEIQPTEPGAGFGMVKVKRQLSIEETNGATMRTKERMTASPFATSRPIPDRSV